MMATKLKRLTTAIKGNGGRDGRMMRGMYSSQNVAAVFRDFFRYNSTVISHFTMSKSEKVTVQLGEVSHPMIPNFSCSFDVNTY